MARVTNKMVEKNGLAGISVVNQLDFALSRAKEAADIICQGTSSKVPYKIFDNVRHSIGHNDADSIVRECLAEFDVFYDKLVDESTVAIRRDVFKAAELFKQAIKFLCNDPVTAEEIARDIVSRSTGLGIDY